MVTGASGFLGIPLCEYLRSKGHEVFEVWNAHRPPGPAKRGLKVDLTSRSAVDFLLGQALPDIIIHTAAFPNVDVCQRSPAEAFSVNAEATGIIASLAPGKVVYTSTDLVFDGQLGWYDENAQPSPPNVYGQSKLQGEAHVLRSGGTVLRLSLLIGRSRSHKLSFLDWLEARLARDETVPLFTDQYRTPVYVPVVCEALEKLTHLPGRAGIFHLGGEQRLNRWELAQKYFRYFPARQHLAKPVQTGDAELTIRGADCSLRSDRLKSALGISTGTMEEAFADLGPAKNLTHRSSL